MFIKAATSLCERFTKFVTKYELMTSDTLIVPIKDDDVDMEAQGVAEKIAPMPIESEA